MGHRHKMDRQNIDTGKQYAYSTGHFVLQDHNDNIICVAHFLHFMTSSVLHIFYILKHNL